MRIRHGRAFFFLVLFAAYAARAGGQALETDDWRVADPDSLHLNADALRQHLDLCRRSGADACLVAYRGYIVQEWYGPEYAHPMPTMSTVKSWTGLLAGMLLAEGRIKSLDEPAANYIPEWKAGAEAGVTLRHLLTMTSGLRRRTDPEGPDRSIGYARDKTGFALSLPLDYPPGARWDYSNEGVQLLSPILERAAGMPLEEYAQLRLFEPLGMDSTSMRLDEAGNVWTYADAKTGLRDFAKIGQLMLNGGRWHGEEIVPAEWVQQSTEPIPQMRHYGLLWWMDKELGFFAAVGYLDTDCIVFPELGLVVARMQKRVKPETRAPYLGEAQQATIALLRRIADEK